jgi:cardiolipin synthase
VNGTNETLELKTELPFREGDAFSLAVAGHELRILPQGQGRLDALIGLIEKAQASLDLVFYIFEPDSSGQRVRDALAAAAGRGVRVRLIVDGFGASADAKFFRPLIDAGGEYSVFSDKWSRRYLIRNHQKILIADGSAGMLGGFNIADDYFTLGRGEGWSDLGLIIRGSALDDLVRWYDGLFQWVADRRAPWRRIRLAVRDWKPQGDKVKVLIGGPTLGLSTWAGSVMRDLDNGNQLDMMMAYFSPAAGVIFKIAEIAKRGAARLVLAGKSDNGATIGAARSLYKFLLKRDSELWEFSSARLHTKLVVIDDVTYIGSANFDMRSLYLNFEIMLRIEDKDFAERMRQYIAHHREHSEPITLEWHGKQAGIINRVRWVLSWFLVGVVDYTVTRRLNLGQ